MLGFLFGFNARLRRLQFFLATIAVAILMTAICFAIFSYAFQHWPRGTAPNLALAMTLWPVLAAAVASIKPDIRHLRSRRAHVGNPGWSRPCRRSSPAA